MAKKSTIRKRQTRTTPSRWFRVAVKRGALLFSSANVIKQRDKNSYSFYICMISVALSAAVFLFNDRLAVELLFIAGVMALLSMVGTITHHIFFFSSNNKKTEIPNYAPPSNTSGVS